MTTVADPCSSAERRLASNGRLLERPVAAAPVTPLQPRPSQSPHVTAWGPMTRELLTRLIPYVATRGASPGPREVGRLPRPGRADRTGQSRPRPRTERRGWQHGSPPLGCPPAMQREPRPVLHPHTGFDPRPAPRHPVTAPARTRRLAARRRTQPSPSHPGQLGSSGSWASVARPGHCDRPGHDATRPTSGCNRQRGCDKGRQCRLNRTGAHHGHQHCRERAGGECAHAVFRCSHSSINGVADGPTAVGE